MANTKKTSAKRKLLPAVGMLAISATMLATSTYAWFTMNKDVQVTGMRMKAQAEKGLLINEVKGADSATWDEEAVSGDVAAIPLRPASTADLDAWWHANSKNSSNEAGASGTSVDTANTVAISTGVYYTDIKPNASGMAAETTNENGVAGQYAERSIYYKDVAYTGNSGSSYDEGEGYYVKYKYYIKASSDTDVDVSRNNFKITVTANKQNTENSGSGTYTDLDRSLRVGVKIDNTTMIFAPLYDADKDYKVAGSINGADYEPVTAKTGSNVSFNTGDTFTIPKVTDEGKEVDVFVWFEGEDENCKSDNLTEYLDDFDVTIKFTNADFG